MRRLPVHQCGKLCLTGAQAHPCGAQVQARFQDRCGALLGKNSQSPCCTLQQQVLLRAMSALTLHCLSKEDAHMPAHVVIAVFAFGAQDQ